VQAAGFGIYGTVYPAGSSLVVHVLMSQRGVSTTVAPTGTVTVTLSPLFQTTVALTPDPYQNQALSTAFVTIPNVPAGTFWLSASYSGDSNWNPVVYTYPNSLTYANTTASPTTTILTLSPLSVNTAGSVTFNASVVATSSAYGAPSGEVLLYGNGTVFAGLGFSGHSAFTSWGSVTVPASEIPLGTVQVVAEYTGGLYMDPSVSSAESLTVTAADFSLTAASRNLAIPSGKSAVVPVSLGGPYAAGITVALSCAPASSGVSCSVSPGSATFTGSGTASLTISAYSLSAAAVDPRGPVEDRRMPASRVAVAAAFLFLLVLPGRRRARMPTLLVALVAALCLATGCGGSSSPLASQGTQGTQTPALAGTYSVVVTGASGGITHSATVSFSVQ
jgi:hypothetical protein